jgi:hypothetical protein
VCVNVWVHMGLVVEDVSYACCPWAVRSVVACWRRCFQSVMACWHRRLRVTECVTPHIHTLRMIQGGELR